MKKYIIASLFVLFGASLAGTFIARAALMSPNKPGGLLSPLNLNNLIITAASPFTVGGSATSTITGDGSTSTIGNNLIVNGDLGIGTSSFSATLTVQGTSSMPSQPLLTLASSTGSTLMTVTASGNVGIGTSTPSQLLTVGNNNQFTVTNAGAVNTASTINSNSTITGSSLVGSAAVYTQTFSGTSDNGYISIQNNRNFTNPGTIVKIQPLTASNSTGGINIFAITPTYTQSGSASSTDFLINRTETSVGTGTQRLFDAQVGGVSKFMIDNGGKVGIGTTIPSSTLDVNGSSTFRNHLGFSTTSVSVSSCGTAPTGTVIGSDNGGVITIGGTATGCILNFATKWVNNPVCTVSNQSMSITSALGFSVTTSTLTLTQAVGLSGNLVDYMCQGNSN